MNIATALNKKYIRYTVVMLTSLCVNNPVHIDAYILNSELEAEDFAKIRNALSNYDISVIPINISAERFDDKLPKDDQWSIEMYYRLLMGEVIPESVERILYLDVDLIINKSIEAFYNVDFDGYEIIATDDRSGNNDPSSYGAKHNEMFKEAYANGYRYFNSGVMLMNLKRLRKEYSFQTYLDAIEEWNYEMDAPDQDILNWVHWKKIGYVDCKVYDYFSRIAHRNKVTYKDAKEKIAIIHYSGSKPWDFNNFHFDIEKIWWEYAKLTPFYEELLEEFVEKAMTDTKIEDFLFDLLKTNYELKDTLGKAYELMKKRIDNK